MVIRRYDSKWYFAEFEVCLPFQTGWVVGERAVTENVQDMIGGVEPWRWQRVFGIGDEGESVKKSPYRCRN